MIITILHINVFVQGIISGQGFFYTEVQKSLPVAQGNHRPLEFQPHLFKLHWLLISDMNVRYLGAYLY